jgi:predicted short-subunit dehydrogenase-like oxidoreductase (DUF2520 family)
MAAPLRGLRFALLGPGKVGTSLALWALDAGARLEAVGGGRGKPLHPRLLEGQRAGADLAAVEADVLLVAVADSALEAVIQRLGSTRCRVVLHVSGSRTAAVLTPLAGASTALGSLHPLWPFSRVVETPPEHIVFGVDGDPPAQEMAERLATAWGGSTEPIPPGSRLLYHFAATLAAGGAATVLAGAAALARKLELGGGVLEGYRRLAEAAVSSVELTAAGPNVTGPVARGDCDLVVAQWKALAEVDPQLLSASRAIARLTLSLVGEREALTEGHRRILRALEGADDPPLS